MSSRENPDPESAAPELPGRARLEFRTLLGLSAPVAAAQLGMMTMGVIDTMMVARVGPGPLAAVALATPLAAQSEPAEQVSADRLRADVEKLVIVAAAVDGERVVDTRDDAIEEARED